MGKEQTTSYNVNNSEVKWTFTLQINNQFLEACCNVNYGSQTCISGTVYEDATIYRDNDKLTIKLEDTSNIVYTQNTRGEPHHHSLVDIAFTNDDWSTRKQRSIKPRLERVDTNAPIKLESIDVLSLDSPCTKQSKTLLEEDNLSMSNDLEERPTETMLVNFQDEDICKVNVKMEQLDSITSNNEELEQVSFEQITRKEDKISRPRRKTSKPKPMTYKEESDSNAEEESNDENLESSTCPEKKLCRKGNVKHEPKEIKKPKNCISSINNNDNHHMSCVEINKIPESETNDDFDTDEYTLSSQDEFETDTESRYDSTESDDRMKTGVLIKEQQYLYAIKVECPVCKMMYKYSRTGIIRHLKCHTYAENRLELIDQLKQNILHLDNLQGNMIRCEFCRKEVCDAFYPLHIQWEHSEKNFERSNSLLHRFFETVKSVDELSSEDIMRKFNMSVAFQPNSTLNLGTSNCKHCGKVFGKTKLIKHMQKCAKNPNRKVVSKCYCGFKSADRQIIKEHRKICRSGRSIYMIKVKCSVCNMYYKYSRTGIIRHIRANHKKEDKQLNLQEKLKQNMINWAKVKDEMTCEFCNRNFSKVSYPLHIHWAHLDQNLEKSQEILAIFFNSQMTVSEFTTKDTVIKTLNTTIVVEESLADDLEISRNLYLLKIKCPVCDMMIKCTKAEILNHINDIHSSHESKLELIEELEHKMRDLEDLEEDHLSCVFCEKPFRKIFLPLHVQWEHSEKHFEKSQDILATYFNTVMSVDELNFESIITNSDMSVTVQESTAELETNSCEYCSKIIGQRKMSTHHKSCHKHPQREVLYRYYNCKCGFRSPKISVIKKHKSTCVCNRENPFYLIKVTCPVCGNSYKYSRSGIIRHLKEFHKDIPNQLEFIQKFKSNMIDWASTEGETLACEFCKSNYSKIFYPCHIQWEHSEKNLERCQNILSNFFGNEMPVGEFCSLEMYKNSELSVVVDNYEKNLETSTCEYCNKVVGKNKLTKHLNKCVKNPQRRIFYYCQCGYKSSEFAVIKEHRRACKTDPVICDICGKKMKSKSHYCKHKKFDHGIISARGTAIQDYPCEDCDEVFQLPSRLKLHRIRRHSDEKNYICEFCSRAYKFPTALKNHIRFAHNNIYRYYCEKCGHGMNKKALVKTHVCGRTRRRLKLHEKWMINLNDGVKQTNDATSKSMKKSKKEHKNYDLSNQQNVEKGHTSNQGSSGQYITASSSINQKYCSPSSETPVLDRSIDIISHSNLRQSANQTESIFPIQSSYINLQPPMLSSGFQYQSFISGNEMISPSSGYDINNYHIN